MNATDVKDVLNSTKREAGRQATEIRQQVSQKVEDGKKKVAEVVRNAQIEFYEVKITNFLKDKLDEFHEDAVNGGTIETIKSQLENSLKDSKSIFSSINNVINFIKGLTPKKYQFDVTNDEDKLLEKEEMVGHRIDPFKRDNLIENLENYKKIQSKKIVDFIFDYNLKSEPQNVLQTFQTMLCQTLQSQLTEHQYHLVELAHLEQTTFLKDLPTSISLMNVHKMR